MVHMSVLGVVDCKTVVVKVHNSSNYQAHQNQTDFSEEMLRILTINRRQTPLKISPLCSSTLVEPLGLNLIMKGMQKHNRLVILHRCLQEISKTY